MCLGYQLPSSNNQFKASQIGEVEPVKLDGTVHDPCQAVIFIDRPVARWDSALRNPHCVLGQAILTASPGGKREVIELRHLYLLDAFFESPTALSIYSIMN